MRGVRIAETEVSEGQVIWGLIISYPGVELCKLKRHITISQLYLTYQSLTYLTVSAVSMFSDSSIRFSYRLSLGNVSAIQAFCSMNFKSNRLEFLVQNIWYLQASCKVSREPLGPSPDTRTSSHLSDPQRQARRQVWSALATLRLPDPILENG